ncbi:MAG: lactonase family protein [Oscillospiraceae bacterium]|nr:lactonase family protein [Oscillospiraceae bacterium]
MPGTKKTFVYIGNWRAKSPGENGFDIFQFNEDTGELKYKKHAVDGVSVGAAYIDTKNNILYAANEQTSLPGRVGGGGQVLAVRLDPESGEMTEFSRTPSYGVDPTYIALDPSGRYMLVTHHVGYMPVTKIGRDPYGKYHIHTEFDDTTTVLFRLSENGAVGEPCDVWKHIGHGPLMNTQANPHIHSTVLSPKGEFFAECDKGSDRIYCFRIDYEAERLVLLNDYQSVPGSSPRHSCFHPTLPYWYMNNESMTILRAFRYDKDGKIDHICTVETLPEGCKDDPTLDKNQRPRQSDIQIHPSGKYLYTLIRGINCLSAYAIDPSDGALEKIQSVELDGKGPRACAFSPDGRFMLITAAESGEILVWAVAEDGKVAPTGKNTSRPSPGTVAFFQP